LIGRASHGAPWIFRAVNVHLEENCAAAAARADLRYIILAHLDSCTFFTARRVSRIARKIRLYLRLLESRRKFAGI